MKPFKSVVNIRPGRSVFDLSHTKLQDANMGVLYPVMCETMVPGDSFRMGNQIVVRAMPLVAPILHEINVTVHYFFVPNRIMWDGWEEFITGGVDGDDASTLPRMNYPTGAWGTSIWNYLGFPKLGVALTATTTKPVDFARRAYLAVFNNYYRDENQMTEIDITDQANDQLLRRSWEKDYFTSSLPFAQRGDAVALPVSGLAPLTGSVDFDFSNLPANGTSPHSTNFATVSGTNPQLVGDQGNGSSSSSAWNTAGVTALDGTADLSSATTFDVNDLRLAFQIQKWMERNARSGVRYTEFLQSHFGVGGNLDSRLQRPEYVGGMKTPVIISEVLQTSSTKDEPTPQGTLAGHGITVASEYAGKYYAQEYGVMIGIMSIMPKPAYHQGVNRQWLPRTRYDYYFPEFATLGEQAIEMAELYYQETDIKNTEVFGFQGRFDEMRYKPNVTCGLLRPGEDFDYWTLTRDFGAKPTLSDTFMYCNPDPRAWAVQVDAPQFVVHIANKIKAIRPLPAMGTPGLIDHH